METRNGRQIICETLSNTKNGKTLNPFIGLIQARTFLDIWTEHSIKLHVAAFPLWENPLFLELQEVSPWVA